VGGRNHVSYKRTDNTANDDKQGKGASPDRAAPSKFFQKGYKKDRKRIPNSIDECEGDETETNDEPSKV
jgi:hypothetical protein